HRVHQPVDDELLVENRKLNGDARQLGKTPRWIGSAVLPVSVIHVNQNVAMNAIRSQNNENHEVGDQQSKVKSIGSVQAFEGFIGEVGFEIVCQTARGEQEQSQQWGRDLDHSGTETTQHCSRTTADPSLAFRDCNRIRMPILGTTDNGHSVRKHGSIERIALDRFESGVADNVAQLFFCSAVAGAGGADYVFFQHHRADIVAAEAQTELQNFQALGYPTGLDIFEVVEEYPRDGQGLEVLDRGGFVPFSSAKGGVFGLKRPRNKGSEAAGFLLQIVDALEVVHAMVEVFTNSEHHRGSSAHAQLVRGAMNIEPVFGQALQARDAIADLIVENLRASAGNRIQPGIAKSCNGVANAEATVFGNCNNLRR